MVNLLLSEVVTCDLNCALML